MRIELGLGVGRVGASYKEALLSELLVKISTKTIGT